MPDTVTAYVGLGSNQSAAQGDPATLLAMACMRMRELPGVVDAAVSPVYRTEPQGDPHQPWFHNQTARLELLAEGEGGPSPEGLLLLLGGIEDELGRRRCRSPHHPGPRTMDLDLLLFGDRVLDDPRCQLPHPRLTGRAFVLVPLLDLDPHARLPDGTSLADCLASLPHKVTGDRIFQP